ncbi:MAG: hypothetical protein MUC87_07750 [Bacteroidia bacterium]|nr:hypothetical protein [Bacteroidia bacterium]
MADEANVSDSKPEEIIINTNNSGLQIKSEEEEKIEQLRPQLEISPEEIAFIQTISNLLGNTPRTIKRFVNIYRLIRVHSEVPDYSIATHADHLAIMLLLAVVTGCNQVAATLFQMLMVSPKETFKEFAADALYDNAVRENNELKKVLTQLEKIEEPVEMEKIRKHIEFVSRFSFRTL